MTRDAQARASLRRLLSQIDHYSRHVVGRPLRPYQLEPAASIVRAARHPAGQTISVLMSRQAGKNELSAHVEAFLLTRAAARGGTIVKASPTFKPQAVNSMLRLRDVLKDPLDPVLPAESAWGYMLKRGKAAAHFLSADPTSNVVGATASLLLEFDEAQDISPERHDRDFAPMAASTAAPRVYYGTGGTDDDLLQQVKAFNLDLEKRDGIRRHFEYPWWVVAEHNPAYGDYVQGEIRRLGESHPIIQSEYGLKPVAHKAGLFNPTQLRQLQGDHPRLAEPTPGRVYVAGIDVAGPAESDSFDDAESHVDSTVVTIAEVERPERANPDDPRPDPIVRVVDVVEWRGSSHLAQHRELVQLLEHWGCRKAAVDATGLGQAPAERLKARFRSGVEPFVFSSSSKSDLGFALLAAANTDRLKLWAAGPDDREAARFWAQLKSVRRTYHAGDRMAWSSPRGHDDYVTSLALCLHAATLFREPAGCVMIPPPAQPWDEYYAPPGQVPQALVDHVRALCAPYQSYAPMYPVSRPAPPSPRPIPYFGHEL